MKILKRFLTATVILTFVCVMALSVNADFSVSIERTQQGENIVQNMKVEGESSEELRYKPVSLLILKPGMAADSVADFEEKYAAVYQSYVRADNKFVFKFPFNEEAGEYTVLIRVNNNDIMSNTIECYDIDDLVFLLKGIKEDSLTAEEVCELLTLKYKNIGVDGELFSQLEESSRIKISEDIMNSMTEYTVDELSEYLYEKTFICVFSSDDTQEIKESIIEAYNDMFGEDIISVCEKYFALDESIRKAVLEEIKTRDADNVEDIITELFDSCFVCEFHDIDNFSEITTLISEYETDSRIAEASETLNGFSASRKNIILRNILKRSGSIKDIESFMDVFNLVVDNIDDLELENNKPSGSGGGGGGGGGVSKRNESTVTVTPPEKEENKENEEVFETVEKVYFDDISEVSWANEAINALTAAKVINGRENGRFAPYENITRAEFSKICALALKIESKNDADIPFKDVKKSHWAYEYIKSLYQNGFIQGVSPDSFNPEAEITRQDIATILFRAVSMSGYEFMLESADADFKDNDKISSYALPAVGMLSKKGVILGFDDNTFKPENNANRAETAVVIHRLLKMLEQEGL